MREFNNETELAENEYLLKIRIEKEWTTYSGVVIPESKTGFLSKLRKADKLPPKSFMEWGKGYDHSIKGYVDRIPDTWIVEQNLCKGWRVDTYRRGTSADWIVVTHPDGYNLEVKTSDFMELLSKISIIKGKITQALRWDRGVLKLD
jgi:hypothetical protein